MQSEVSREEVAARAARGRLVFVVNNTVYDVSSFAEDHPGGREVFAAAAGGDATQCWFDVGHSEEAQALMLSYVEGAVPRAQRRPELRRAPPPPPPAPSAAATAAALIGAVGPPLILAIVASVIYFYLLS